MGSVHFPRLTGRGRAGPHAGRLRRIGLAAAVLAAMAVAGGVHSAASAATGAPYGGTAAAVPGTVYAANYDTGGQGVAYNVTSANGVRQRLPLGRDRPRGHRRHQNNTGAGADDIGWTTAGQWFNYTVNVATAGTYTVAFRVSSPYGIADALHIDNSSGTNLTGSVTIPNTGGYETWTTVDASVTLPAGQQTLTVDQDSNGWNFHYMTFTLSSGGGGSGAHGGGDAPFGGTPAAVPGTVQAANYDTGGQGVAYNVTSANGIRQQLPLGRGRPGDHRRHAGHQRARRRLRHRLDEPRAVVQVHRHRGHGRARTRSASGSPRPYGITDALHITNSSNVNLTGSVAVPNTGGYETWTTVTATVTLPAGVQTLTVDQDSNGFNFHYLAFATGSSGGTPPGGGGTGKYCGTTDLAMDQPTTASSVQASSDYLPYYATDGDPGTRWSSLSSDPQWLEVDLGTPTAICSVGILWEAAYATAFQIQVVQRQLDLDHGLLHHHRHRRPGDVPDQHDRPLHPDVRHGPRDHVRLLDLRVRRLRPDTPPLAGGNGNGGNGSCGRA